MLMSSRAPGHAVAPDFSAPSEFARAVITGLSQAQKALPCRFLYDARGSELFEDITRLPEYYPTRAEISILEAHTGEMAEGVTKDGVLVEFGSGSSRKTEIFLTQLPAGLAYVPIDVSATALAGASGRLAKSFPDIHVRPIVGDFSQEIILPDDLRLRPKTGFFPGSTIGNFSPQEALGLLGGFRQILCENGRLLIGVDLKKDQAKLVRAYADAAGVTAEFNLNLLVQINRELGGTFDVSAFRHEAIYNERLGRVEMHIVSVEAQSVVIAGRCVSFEADERIHTENAYKYSVGEFQDLAGQAGWRPTRVWTDANAEFSVHELRVG
jgi:dimethylhistidine N-methyltransferase